MAIQVYGVEKSDDWGTRRVDVKACDHDDVSSGNSLKKLLDTTGSTAYMFYDYRGDNIDGLIDKEDTSLVFITDNMFGNCYNLTHIPELNLSNVRYIDYMFSFCNNLHEIPQSLSDAELRSVKGAFNYCTDIVSIPVLNTSEVDNMECMFRGCESLVTIPLIDTQNVINMKEMFRGCEKLTTIPELNMENVQEANNMFDGCKELLTIPNLNTSNVLYMTDMFCNCEKLTEIKGLDMSSIPPDAECTADMFENCLSLTDLRINNINALELRIGGTSFKGKWGHLLSVESLIYILNELLPDNRNSNTRTLYVGEDNLTKLGNIYVKLVDITTEMETTDPRIHDKYPMVLCDSDDPEAMDIWGYIGYKNWNIEA